MLKRYIKYMDYSDPPKEKNEIFYFNISQAEILELEVSEKEGFGEMLQRIVETQNNQALVQEFKNLILLSYGVKSDDGKEFVKSEELRTKFSQSAAYNALFIELATVEGAADTFIKGVFPAGMIQEANKAALLASRPSPIPPPSVS